MAKQNVRKLFEHQLKVKQLTSQKNQGYVVPEAFKEEMSQESIDIIRHFGPNAPDLLNRYATSLEDALIEQVENHNKRREQCLILADEVMRLRELVPEEDRHPSNLQSDS